jgi:hypothetical protein
MKRSLILLAALSAACVSTQDFPDDQPPPAAVDQPPGDQPDGGSIGDKKPEPIGTYEWQWANPSPTGRTLYAISGSAENDVWVAGEGGTVSHWNGKIWDIKHRGPDGARYFSVGAVSANEVWVAGELNGSVSVVHYDGKDWKESFPFAGSKFTGFSHGEGKRLFALVDWDIQELQSDGTWKSTDTKANDVFGAPQDLWVSSTGESWAILLGAKIMHLPAGSTTWEMVGPIAGMKSNTAGISISGAGAKVCAFYTSFASTGVSGYLTYDGSWHVAPTTTDVMPFVSDAHGAPSACFPDGSGLLTYGGYVVLASPTEAPGAHMADDFQGETLYAAWSPGGTKAFAVGTLGAFVTRAPGAISGAEAAPTVRKDMLAIDVALDGTVMAADSDQPDHSSGGDILFYRDGAFVTQLATTGQMMGPQIPIGIAAVSEGDAWILANDGSQIGVAHWKNGAFGVTRMLGGFGGGQPLAIFAAAKDDVWITATKGAWHYDGTNWNDVAVDASYKSIHGSAPDDVWFVGDAVAHWDGKNLSRVLPDAYDGVWSSTKGRVWLWGAKGAVLYDGKTSTPVQKVLGASAEWTTVGIAEATSGDVFVLTKRATGTSLLWFDPSHTKLVEQLSSDLELWQIRGRGNELWAIGQGGASLRFAPPTVH